MRHFNFFSPSFSLCWLVSSIFTLQIRFVSLGFVQILLNRLWIKFLFILLKFAQFRRHSPKICLNSFSFALFKFFIHLLSFAQFHLVSLSFAQFHLVSLRFVQNRLVQLRFFYIASLASSDLEFYFILQKSYSIQAALSFSIL